MSVVQVLHPILSFGPMYRLAMTMLGGNSVRKTHINSYIRPKAGDRVIDLGCGPCDILNDLPTVDYTGIDIEEKYIADAKARFGDKGTFICKDVDDLVPGAYTNADIALITGVIHHLNDDQAKNLLVLARSCLKPGGRLITFDGCFFREWTTSFRHLDVE